MDAGQIFAYDLAPAGPKFVLMRGSIGRQYIDWIKNNMEMLGICHSFLQLLQRFKRAQRVGIDRLQCKAATDLCSLLNNTQDAVGQQR